MPIHDQSYRRYRGHRGALGRSWLVIAAAGIKQTIKKRVFLSILLLGWIQFIGRAIQLWLASNMPQTAELLGPTADTFRDFLDKQGFAVFVVTVYVGAGLIANDRRANALQIYLSKPLTRAEYIFGKLAILMTFLALVTWLPAIVLLIVQISFAGNFTFFRNNIFLFPAITVFSFVQITMVATAMLALSSLSKSSRYVGVLYAGLIFFSQSIYGVLYAVTRSTAMSWISFPANLAQVGDVIFRQPLKYDTPWPVSLLMIVGLIALSGVVLERRVRGVEVVA
jgi:ABC-2 type transport system permease protein